MEELKISNDVTITTVGSIGTESAIKMSEKNFKKLLRLFFALMPNKTRNEHEFTKRMINEVKDKLVELQYKTTAELSLDLLTNTLKESLDTIQFETDLREFLKKINSPEIVGKIDLNKSNDMI